MLQITLGEIHLFVILVLFNYFSNPFISKSDSLRDLTIFIVSSISSFETINVVVPDLSILFWIIASATDTPADNPNGIKILLAKRVSTLFISRKSAVNNGLRKLRNPQSCLAISVVVSFNKIPLFSKVLITFITSFISLLVRVTPEPVIDVNLS